MRIQVDVGRRVLTYEIAEPVEVGDTVMVPPPFWVPHDLPREVKVVALGSDYDGPCVRAWLPRGGNGDV